VKQRIWPIAAVIVAMLATGCASPAPSASEAAIPPVLVPSAWQSPVSWEPAQPADHVDKGRWWRIFDDALLDHLVERAQQNNASIAVVAARLRQAQAGTRIARAGGLPRLDVSLRPGRQRTSANRPAATSSAQAIPTVQNDFVLTAGASYELDLFDRVAGELANATEAEHQARADLNNARLVLDADLAASYFALRQVDTEVAVLKQSIQLQSRAIDLLNARRDVGAASGLEVAQQQAQLEATVTQLELLLRQRPLIEHSLATLSGQPAPLFNLTAQPDWRLAVPQPPAALPAQVLQRRPDVAAAQHAVAAANAQIGVARSAFYPSIVLGVGAGFESRDIGTLLNGPSLLWSLGASVAQNIFDGGRNRARLDSARAAHDAATAAYKRTVLQALQEVEDGLSSVDALGRAARSAEAATVSASKTLGIAQARYDGGLASYLDVVTAQQVLLNSQRQLAQVNGQRLVAIVQLVKALGGGWQDA